MEERGLPSEDFERAYSLASGREDLEALREEMEDAVESYFRTLELPSTPTIYDYLIRSLRRQDIIATFNWDPFLEQAIQRVPDHLQEQIPGHAYLHGTVALNECASCHRLFSWTVTCPRCGGASEPQRLLYPVENKDYAVTPGVKEAWSNLDRGLNGAYMLSIFGYSGPATDQEAVEMFTRKWRSSAIASMGDISFINTCDRAAIEASWSGMLARLPDGRVHWNRFPNYWSTRIARFPRRSCEESYQRNILLDCWEATPYPDCASLEELDSCFEHLLSHEGSHDNGAAVPTSISPWPDVAQS
jgi:hypothetical protein